MSHDLSLACTDQRAPLRARKEEGMYNCIFLAGGSGRQPAGFCKDPGGLYQDAGVRAVCQNEITSEETYKCTSQSCIFFVSNVLKQNSKYTNA